MVKYVLNYNGVDQVLYTTPSIESNQFFSVGINLQTITNAFGENVSAFFGNQNGLKILEESIHREREGLPIPDRNRKLIVVSIKVISFDYSISFKKK